MPGGAGVLLAIKLALNPVSCSHIDSRESESIWAKIATNGQTHYICSYYKPPDQPVEDLTAPRDQLNEVCQSHPPEKQPPIHVMGDFNFRNIDWVKVIHKNRNQLSDTEGLVLIDMRDFYISLQSRPSEWPIFRIL